MKATKLAAEIVAKKVRDELINYDATLDIEYNRDLSDLKKEFAGINRMSNEEMLAWFVKHPYLCVNDMARIADVSHKTIYKWRKRVGWQPPNAAPMGHVKQPPYPKTFPKLNKELVAPTGWDLDWLAERYNEGFSIPQLMRATGCTYTAIRCRLIRRKVKLRTVKESSRTTNPCCSLAWLFEHYVEKAMSRRSCAKLAGVTVYTISVWLSYFKIRVRPAIEQTLILNGTNLDKVNRATAVKSRTSKKGSAVAI